MLVKSLMISALTFFAAWPLRAEITVENAYVLSASPMAKTGAVYMDLHNSDAVDDHLISVTTEIAARAEVHGHTDLGNSVMQMGPVEGGVVIPAQGQRRLMRGGEHVMLMGLSAPLVDGATVTITLRFETAGDLTVQIPVDQDGLDAGG